jgi:hypothetical protein
MSSTLASFTVDSIRQWNKAYTDALNPDYKQPSFPLFIAQPNIYNPRADTTFVSVNPLNPGMINTGFYKDLNKDKSVQKTLSKYYFYKIIDKWIYKELLPLLAFVDTSSEKPQLIKSLADYDVQKLAKDSEHDIEKKAKYMEEIIITKDMVRHVLKKICNDNQINWYDLNKHERKIKKVFYNYLLDKLKESVGKYGNKN